MEKNICNKFPKNTMVYSNCKLYEYLYKKYIKPIR